MFLGWWSAGQGDVEKYVEIMKECQSGVEILGQIDLDDDTENSITKAQISEVQIIIERAKKVVGR